MNEIVIFIFYAKVIFFAKERKKNKLRKLRNSKTMTDKLLSSSRPKRYGIVNVTAIVLTISKAFFAFCRVLYRCDKVSRLSCRVYLFYVPNCKKFF